MKTSTICFTIVLTCSCCHITDDTHPGSTQDAMTRHDEIRKIMRDHWIHEFETEGLNVLWFGAERKKVIRELRKMKKDYYYELSDPNISLSVPGPGWAIRGPLTIAQIEQKALEEIRESPDVPQVPFGYENDNWNKLKSQYKDGDEFYFFASDDFSWRYTYGEAGYVLIRDNQIVGLKVTARS